MLSVGFCYSMARFSRMRRYTGSRPRCKTVSVHCWWSVVVRCWYIAAILLEHYFHALYFEGITAEILKSGFKKCAICPLDSKCHQQNAVWCSRTRKLLLSMSLRWYSNWCRHWPGNAQTAITSHDVGRAAPGVPENVEGVFDQPYGNWLHTAQAMLFLYTHRTNSREACGPVIPHRDWLAKPVIYMSGSPRYPTPRYVHGDCCQFVRRK